jgi:hypothetical protein
MVTGSFFGILFKIKIMRCDVAPVLLKAPTPLFISQTSPYSVHAVLSWPPTFLSSGIIGKLRLISCIAVELYACICPSSPPFY